MIDKQFFRIDDGHVWWVIVAADREHAVTILRKQGALFGDEEREIDEALRLGHVEIRELTREFLADHHRRCHTEDERGAIPLLDGNIGEAFCSEW